MVSGLWKKEERERVWEEGERKEREGGRGGEKRGKFKNIY